MNCCYCFEEKHVLKLCGDNGVAPVCLAQPEMQLQPRMYDTTCINCRLLRMREGDIGNFETA